MYEQGFAQVSSAYNFISRNVTNPYSVKVRDQYLAEARSSLKNLASMDLSQQQNVNAARKVFEPFAKNQLVLMDMAYTAHMDQQEAIAESYRLKDGGKEFSEDNLNFLRKQRAAFANDDVRTVGNYYNNRRSFTPYYDWNKEFKEWFASYKPDKISVDTKDGLYKITEERGGASPEDLKLFFSSVASEKARNQMRIESTVRLADNPEQLAGIYAGMAQKDISALDGKIASLDNQMKLTKDAEVIRQLRDQKKVFEDKKFELSSDVDKISQGDIGFIKSNADKLAFGIYFDQAVSRLAKGLSWTEYKKSFTADEVALAKWREAMADARQERADARADRRALWELEGLPMGSGNFVTLSATEKDLLEKPDLGSTQKSLDDVKNGIKSVSMSLTQHVATQLGKDASKVTEQDITDFKNSSKGKRDKVYDNFRHQLINLEVDQRNLESQLQQARAFAEKSVGADNLKKAKDTYKGKVGKSAGGFTADDVFEAVKSGNFTLPAGVITGQPMYVAGTGEVSKTQFTINGKVIPVKDSKTYNTLRDMVSQAQSSLKKYQEKYDEGMQKYFKESVYVNPRAIPLPQSTKNFKNLAGVIGGITGVDDGSIKQILAGGNNDAFFYVDNERTRKGGEEAASFFKEIETKLKFQGLEARYDAERGLVYVKEKPGFSKVKLGIDMYQNYTPIERKLTTFGQTQAGNGWMSTPFYPNNMSMDKRGNPLPSYQFKVSSVDGQNMYYLYADGDNSPLSSSFSLTDLIDDAKSTQSVLYEKGYRPQ